MPDSTDDRSRRRFLREVAFAGLGASTAFDALAARAQEGSSSVPARGRRGRGYGSLRPVADETTGLPLLLLDMRTGQTLEPRPVSWVDIDRPDPAPVATDRTFEQGLAKGGARFTRLEGAWHG